MTTWLPMWTMSSAWSKQSHGCSCPGCRATNHTGTLRNLLNPASGIYTNTRRNSSEPSGTFRTLPLEPTPTRSGTLRNPPEPSKTFRNQPCGTFRNLPPEPTPACPPEPSGTCLWNLHQHTRELSGTFRNLPEPSSGTCSCDPHRHTPELIWAEDPISLRCWGKKKKAFLLENMKSNIHIKHVAFFKSLEQLRNTWVSSWPARHIFWGRVGVCR